VKILCDSNLRGTASKIDHYLNTKFEVCSWIKPRANTKEIVNTSVKDLKYLGTQDGIVTNGGSNDIGSKRNQTHKVQCSLDLPFFKGPAKMVDEYGETVNPENQFF
jgi:hypothetical protein